MVIGRGRRREHPNQHFVLLLLRKKDGKKTEVTLCLRGIEVSVPIQVNDVYVCYRRFDSSLTHIYITVLAW